MRRIVQFAVCLSIAASALANDTMTETSAGGLVLKRTDAVDMVSEDLYVSAKQIRVHYIFRNRTPRDLTATVAFPIDRDLSQEIEGDIGLPGDFHTRVAGLAVTTRLEQHALLHGRDYTALLQSLRIPLEPKVGGPDRIGAALDRLRSADRARLRKLGLIGFNEAEPGTLMALWTVRDLWYWQQTFPAGRDLVIDHQYRPGAGGTAGTLLTAEYRNSADEAPDVRQEIARYCIDHDFLSSLDHLSGREKNFPEAWVSYILTTGANWRSPIGSFRLVVDKGEPGNLVSFCESGVKKISPTQYEVRHSNWRPTRDLHVLIIESAR